MYGSKMSIEDIEFCKKAVAYLKPELPDLEADTELSEMDAPVLTRLGNGLLVSYLVDTGDSFEYVSERRRASAGLSDEELNRIAISNLEGLENNKEIQVVKYENVFAVLWDGNFEASLLLLDRFWENDYAFLVPNGAVAALPSRDVLAFCDAESSLGIQELREVISRTDEADHLISKNLYRRKHENAAWERYDN